MGRRIKLGPNFHAEEGKTPGHLHEVYMTKDVPPGMERCHVGQLTKVAVRAWQRAEGQAADLDEEHGADLLRSRHWPGCA